MIFLIFGLFFGLIAILTLANGGILFAAFLAVFAIVFIAAGIQNLSGNDPNKALEAIRRLQQEGPPADPLSAEQIRRLPELLERTGHPLDAEQIRYMQELAQRSGHPLSVEEVRRLQERAQSKDGDTKPHESKED